MATCITFFNDHPACLNIFTGPGATFHFLLGWLAGTMEPGPAIALATMFTGYQLSQAQTGEPWTNTGGELVEFGLGILAGSMFR